MKQLESVMLSKGEKVIQNESHDSLHKTPNFQEETEPDKIVGFSRLPLPVQSQLRALAKPRKDRTDRDLNKLTLDVKEVEFFKLKQLDKNTMHQIISSAGWSYMQKGKWVFKEGD